MRFLRTLLAVLVITLGASHLEARCSFQQPPQNLVLGSYSVFGTGTVDGLINFTVLCTAQDTGWVHLSRGLSTSFTPRTLMQGSNPMAYNLYTDAAGTQIWGDGTGGTVFENYPNGRSDDTIYARIPQGVDAIFGTHTDNIVATVFWAGGSESVNFSVTATVLRECRSTGPTLGFGNYEPIATNATTPLPGSARLDVFCTRGTFGTVQLDGGTNAVGAVRRMRSPINDFLVYDLFREASFSTVWNLTNVNSSTSTSKDMALGGGGLMIYGRIPAGQDVSAGNYSDTVRAIINY